MFSHVGKNSMVSDLVWYHYLTSWKKNGPVDCCVLVEFKKTPVVRMWQGCPNLVSHILVLRYDNSGINFYIGSQIKESNEI